MATAVLPELESAPRAVAPWWHTALLVAFFILMAAGGASLQHGARGRANLVEQRPDMAVLYLSLIAGEWALVYYVWRGLRRRGVGVLALVGGRWARPRDVLRDVSLACGIWVVWKGVLFLLEHTLGTDHAASISPLTPRGASEAALWVILSISAGIAEELVFRGYLQRQLTAFTGRIPLAVVAQAAVFGIAHGYQGVHSCLAIAAYGLLFTLVALWRNSLRPGMMAHAWTDIAGGLLGW